MLKKPKVELISKDTNNWKNDREIEVRRGKRSNMINFSDSINLSATSNIEDCDVGSIGNRENPKTKDNDKAMKKNMP